MFPFEFKSDKNSFWDLFWSNHRIFHIYADSVITLSSISWGIFDQYTLAHLCSLITIIKVCGLFWSALTSVIKYSNTCLCYLISIEHIMIFEICFQINHQIVRDSDLFPTVPSLSRVLGRVSGVPSPSTVFSLLSWPQAGTHADHLGLVRWSVYYLVHVWMD